MMRSSGFLLAAILCLPLTALADHSLTAKVGTLGIGAEYRYQLNDQWAFRGSINQFDFGYDDTIDGILYDGDLELSSLAAVADYHPFSGAFRITAGVLSNQNEFSLLGSPTGNVDIGNETYTAAEVGTLGGNVEFDSLAPYLGIGWGTGKSGSVRIDFDLGVVFQGSPNGSLVATGTLTGDAAFQQELEVERQTFEKELEDFELFPVLSIGIGYTF